VGTFGSLLRALRGLRGFRAGLTANWYQPTNLPDQPTELFAHIREHNLWQGVLAYQHKDGSHFVGTDLRRSSFVHGKEQQSNPPREEDYYISQIDKNGK
jgi:hypothetical protein